MSERNAREEDEGMSSEEEALQWELLGESKKKTRNTNKYPKMLEQVARFDLSGPAVSAVINGYNADMGINLKENPEVVVSESSLRYKKNKLASELSDQPLTPTSSVFIDGKRYNTLLLESADEETRRNAAKVLEHFVVANPENNEYMGEYIPLSGTGKDVALGLINFLGAKV